MPKKKIKKIVKSGMTARQKLRNSILKAQKNAAQEEKVTAYLKSATKAKKKVYNEKSIIKRAGARLKRLFSKKKKKQTGRFVSVPEQQEKRKKALKGALGKKGADKFIIRRKKK